MDNNHFFISSSITSFIGYRIQEKTLDSSFYFFSIYKSEYLVILPGILRRVQLIVGNNIRVLFESNISISESSIFGLFTSQAVYPGPIMHSVYCIICKLS